jgi:hypothetical protein
MAAAVAARAAATAGVRAPAEVSISAAAAVLPDRELRRLPLDLETFGTRQLRPDQRTVDRTFVDRRSGLRLVVFDLCSGSFGPRHGDGFVRVGGAWAGVAIVM